jgi:hypothetical protein
MSKKLEWVANDFKEPRNIEVYNWRSQFVVGDPQPIINADTVESLKAMGLVGLYREAT